MFTTYVRLGPDPPSDHWLTNVDKTKKRPALHGASTCEHCREGVHHATQHWWIVDPSCGGKSVGTEFGGRRNKILQNFLQDDLISNISQIRSISQVKRCTILQFLSNYYTPEVYQRKPLRNGERKSLSYWGPVTFRGIHSLLHRNGLLVGTNQNGKGPGWLLKTLETMRDLWVLANAAKKKNTSWRIWQLCGKEKYRFINTI